VAHNPLAAGSKRVQELPDSAGGTLGLIEQEEVAAARRAGSCAVRPPAMCATLSLSSRGSSWRAAVAGISAAIGSDEAALDAADPAGERQRARERPEKSPTTTSSAQGNRLAERARPTARSLRARPQPPLPPVAGPQRGERERDDDHGERRLRDSRNAVNGVASEPGDRVAVKGHRPDGTTRDGGVHARAASRRRRTQPGGRPDGATYPEGMTVSTDLFAMAAPACPECPQRIQRVEQTWDWDERDGWRLRASTVCAGGHRVPVQPLDDPRR
jgi:hypothetical protein